MGNELVRLLRPLEAMMRWFDAAGVRAAIIGGVAASLLGKPRLTRDIDAVMMDADAEALIRKWGSVWISAEDHGCSRLRSEHEQAFTALHRRGTFPFSVVPRSR